MLAKPHLGHLHELPLFAYMPLARRAVDCSWTDTSFGHYGRLTILQISNTQGVRLDALGEIFKQRRIQAICQKKTLGCTGSLLAIDTGAGIGNITRKCTVATIRCELSAYSDDSNWTLSANSVDIYDVKWCAGRYQIKFEKWRAI